jgi:hypothetical protein
MRIPTRLLPLMAAGALLSTWPVIMLQSAGAQQAQPDQAQDTTPYTWQFQYKKGTVSKYRTLLTVNGHSPDGNQINVEVNALASQEVKEATDTGDATLVSTAEHSSVKFNGQDLPDNSASHLVITDTVSRKGLLLKHETENAPPDPLQLDKLLAVLANMPVPDQPVKIGDSWKTELDNPGVPGKKISMTSTLVGKEKVAGIDTLKIKTQLALPTADNATDQDTIKLEGTYNMDPKEGRLVRADSSIANLHMGGATISIKIQNVLIMPGVNDKEEAAAQDKPAAK